MAKNLSVINVVDVESTCWEGDPPPGQMSEIIEIGIVQINLKTLEVGKPKSIIVRPERSTVSEFCTKLTTLTQEQVNRGVELKEACRTISFDFKTYDNPWASYGDYDRVQFDRVCKSLGVKYPFGGRHTNVKTVLGAAFGWGHEIGMSEALNAMGMKLEGTHHRAGDDVGNIAAMFASLLRTARIVKPEAVGAR